MTMEKILWGTLRRSELEEAAKAGAIVIIPVASIEQHRQAATRVPGVWGNPSTAMREKGGRIINAAVNL